MQGRRRRRRPGRFRGGGACAPPKDGACGGRRSSGGAPARPSTIVRSMTNPDGDGTRGQGFLELWDVLRRLRGDNGCPWDREQTLATLTPYLIEEAYEILDA